MSGLDFFLIIVAVLIGYLAYDALNQKNYLGFVVATCISMFCVASLLLHVVPV
jgi:hypothetical protein